MRVCERVFQRVGESVRVCERVRECVRVCESVREGVRLAPGLDLLQE